ncbi:MAG: hypothetical protein A2Y98_02355 [Candidatus Portnoybacteria bacterium RBG_19FT_COMBO_36_7]|uniref:Uncharacterized protein n=1 Tax=Candidatus Portnoybacteria bacterium RBG_19FT_COMBO_36_7 TaxID=1801992 RepID=A0A1G2F8S3_9BACT|nr:MAG: hypothetical protein A2Y98_02355 [Candidatus Portnoybacteria bacterium RBG_19FT_COMBO_36_7]
MKIKLERDIKKFDEILRFLERKRKQVYLARTMDIPKLLPTSKRLVRIKKEVNDLNQYLWGYKSHKLAAKYNKPRRPRKKQKYLKPVPVIDQIRREMEHAGGIYDPPR